MKCLNCDSETSNSKFCCRSCAGTFNNNTQHWRKTHGIFKGLVNCINCGQSCKKNSSKFCKLSCNLEYNLKQRIESGKASSRTIKRYLISIHGNKCSNCGITEWDNKSIVMELEHKDGDSSNNSLDNTCLLCPNCHSQTSTYKNRNKGKGRHSRRIRYASGKSY